MICGNSGELLIASLTVHAHTMARCRIETAVRKFFGERSMHLVARTRELNGTLADPWASHRKTRRGIVSNRPDEHRRAARPFPFARAHGVCLSYRGSSVVTHSRPYFFFARAPLSARGWEVHTLDLEKRKRRRWTFNGRRKRSNEHRSQFLFSLVNLSTHIGLLYFSFLLFSFFCFLLFSLVNFLGEVLGEVFRKGWRSSTVRLKAFISELFDPQWANSVGRWRRERNFISEFLSNEVSVSSGKRPNVWLDWLLHFTKRRIVNKLACFLFYDEHG